MALPLYTRVLLSISFVLSSEVIFIFYGRSSYSKYIAIAAIFSFIGDMIMANIINLKDKRLIGGIVFFFITHIFLVTGYTKTVMETGRNFRYLPYASIFLFSLFILLWLKFILRSKSDIMVRLGGLIYGLTIAFMVSSSFNLAMQGELRYLFTFCGAASFIISDLLIAIGEIGGVNIKNNGIKVWITYFLAQVFIIYASIL